MGGGNCLWFRSFPTAPVFWNGNDYAECLTAKGADDRMPDKGRLPCVPIVMAHGQANAEITEGYPRP